MALAALVAVAATVAGLALVLDYRRARLKIAASTAEAQSRAELEAARLAMYRTLVEKSAAHPAEGSCRVGAFFESRSVFARLVQVAGEPGPLAARMALRALEDHVARRPPLLGDLRRGPCRSSPLTQNSFTGQAHVNC